MSDWYLCQLNSGVRYRFDSERKRVALFAIADEMDYLGNMNKNGDMCSVIELFYDILDVRDLDPAFVYYLKEELKDAIARYKENHDKKENDSLGSKMDQYRIREWIEGADKRKELAVDALDGARRKLYENRDEIRNRKLSSFDRF